MDLSTERELTPAARLGLTIEIVDDSSYMKSQKIRDTGTEFSTRADVAGSLVSKANGLASQWFLLGEWNKFKQWSPTLLECVEHYFFGAFRLEEKDFGTWVYKLGQGLGWGSVGGLWSSIDKLLSYPIDTLPPDEEGQCAHQLYIGLAQWWKNRSDLDWVDQVKNVRGVGSKYYHLLADCVRSIATKDNPGFNKNIEKCIQQYYKSSRGAFEFPMAAIFLRNLAEREGMTVSVPEDVDKYLFKLPGGA